MILGAKVLEMFLNLTGIMKQDVKKLKLAEMSKHKVQQQQLH